MTRARESDETAERHQSLWLLTAGPLFWAGHFALSYATVAVCCARFVGPGGSLLRARFAIGAYTVVALGGIAVTAWIAWRKFMYGGAVEPYDADTPAGRHRFLGFASLLLASLSAVATAFAALAAAFIRSCY